MENNQSLLKSAEGFVRLEILKTYLPGLLMALAFILLYWPAINESIYDWSNDDNYSHGFLIPVISLYLLWMQRDELKGLVWQKNSKGLVLMLAGLLLFIVGTAAAEWFSVRFSLIIVLLGLLWYLGGTKILGKVWFPIAFLVFAIPLPYTLFRTLTFPLQLFSTKVTHQLIVAVGIPALREGNMLYLPGYTLEVVEACSGLRSIIILSALASVFSYMAEGGVFYKLLLFAMSIPVAIVANVFRLLVVSFGALLISPGFAEGFLHEFSGILVFMVGLTLFFIIGSVFNWIGKKLSTGLRSA